MKKQEKLIKELCDKKTLEFLKKWGILVLLITLPITTINAAFGQRFLTLQKSAEELPTASFTLSSNTTTQRVGEMFRTTLQIKTQEEVAIAKAVLQFDPKHLQVVELAGGQDFPGQIRLNYDNEKGTVVFEQNVGASKNVKISRGTLDFGSITFIPTTETTKTTLTFKKNSCYVMNFKEKYLNLNFSKINYSIN